MAGATSQLLLNAHVGSIELQTETSIILLSRYPFSDHANSDDLNLRFCRGRLRNEQSFKTHVVSICSVYWIFCFYAFSLWLPPWFALNS